jgi:DNA polymerase-3 subunit alpha
MNEDLLEWLQANKIAYEVVDDECINIIGLGKAFIQDTEIIKSIFVKRDDGSLDFHCVENLNTLKADEINHVVFKFGDNWYIHNINQPFSLNVFKFVGTHAPAQIDLKYINLGVHTPFELLNGSFMLNMWIKKAKYLGHDAIGVCDYNTMASLFILQKETKAAGIKPVFGYSLTFEYDGAKVGAKVYVQTQEGLRNLLRIQKTIMVDSDDHIIPFNELVQRGGGNIIVLDKYSSKWVVDNAEAVDMLLDSYINVMYQVDLSEYKAERIDIRVLEATKYYFDNIYKHGRIQPVLITDCYYLDKDDARNKIILNKIATGAAHEQSNEQYFKDIDEQYALFTQLFDEAKWDIYAIFKQCCDNTYKIADGAVAKFETTRNFMPKYDMTEEEAAKYGTTHNMFTQLLEEGLQRLAPPDRIDEYRKQMELEKYIIESTDNVDYLLVQYDTVNWCKRNGILVGCGRGSAAGSLLLYLLGITLVDPMKYGLIFERFLLPERAGLYPADTTKIVEPISSQDYYEITLDSGITIKLDKDAELVVKREGEEKPIVVYADELQPDDDILFDNHDKLFTLNEI